MNDSEVELYTKLHEQILDEVPEVRVRAKVLRDLFGLFSKILDEEQTKECENFDPAGFMTGVLYGNFEALFALMIGLRVDFETLEAVEATETLLRESAELCIASAAQRAREHRT